MAQNKDSLAFLGLGAMGFGMAAHFVSNNYQVTGFDIYPPTLQRFKAAGGLAATTPAEAVSGKQLCVVMVANEPQTQSVLLDGENAAVPALPTGATLLLCSTVSCSYVQKLERAIKELGRGDVHLIDCPVSGGAGRAASGELSIMVGASDAGVDKARDVLLTMANPEKLFIVKGGIGAGSNMKMVHQVLAATHILSTSEAMGFADCLDLDLPKTKDAIMQSNGWSWMFENRIGRLLEKKYMPAPSAVTIITKDSGIITSEARRARYPTPMVSTAEQAYLAAVARGYGADDDSGLTRLYTDGKELRGPLAAAAAKRSDQEKTELVLNMLVGIHLCSAAETMAFAHRVGLDLDQVIELCLNAAGGSSMYTLLARPMADALREGAAKTAASGSDVKEVGSLSGIYGGLAEAVGEAQRLKMPLYLGNQALNLVGMALRQAGKNREVMGAAGVLRMWVA